MMRVLEERDPINGIRVGDKVMDLFAESRMERVDTKMFGTGIVIMWITR